MRLQFLPLLAAFAPTVLADFLFTSPAAGAVVPAGQAVTVTVAESNVAPAISSFSTYTLELVQGGQTQGATQRVVATFASGASYAAGYTITGTIPVTAAGVLANSFFFKLTSVATEGGTVINWSSRFSVSGLTGTNPANIVTAVTQLNGATAGPGTINNMAAAGGGAPGAPQWSIPYELQTGLTKWAPMQPIPPSKITQTAYTPLFPTSAHVTATTWLPPPTIVMTVTQSQTFSVSSYENQATPQSNPDPNMAKYLRRWQDEV